MINNVKKVVQYYELIKDGDYDFTIINLNEKIDQCSIQEQREIFEEISNLLKDEKRYDVSHFLKSSTMFESLYINATTALNIARIFFYKLHDTPSALDLLEVADRFQCLYIKELNSLDCLQDGDYQLTPNVDYTAENIKYGYVDFDLIALKQAKVIVDYYKYKGWIN